MTGRMIKIALLTAVFCVGCSAEPTIPTLPPAPTPLTVEQWKTLPISEKYDEATFERLKLQDSKLKSDREWEKFMKTVIIPERKIDIPGIPGQ